MNCTAENVQLFDVDVHMVVLFCVLAFSQIVFCIGRGSHLKLR